MLNLNIAVKNQAIHDTKRKVTARTIYPTFKRIFDITLVLVTSPIWFLLFTIVCAVVYFTSPGPAIFKQKRVGKNGKIFTLYKFRSMYITAPSTTPTYLLKNPETHITPVGRFIRKYSLDELPQIFNILKGDMSVVGPRPAQPNEKKLLKERDKYNANSIHPGLTGLAQVILRDNCNVKSKTELDGDYVKAMSFFVDVKLIFATVWVVASAHNFYEGKRE